MGTMSPVRMAVLGAGLIGKRRIEHILAEPEARLYAVVDPSPIGESIAEQNKVSWYPSFAAMITAGKPDGVVIATPNQMHVQNGLEAVAAGLPALVEKPIADDIVSGTRLVEAAEKAGVSLIAGHHRSHNPVIQRAKAIIVSGRLGRLVAVHCFFWLMKPDEYFDIAWRREKGAGPVLVNLSHDIDLLRYLCGEVESVQALQSSAIRGHPVDETTVVLLRFTNGAHGTVNACDTVVAPWSWEHTAGENPAYPRTDQACYFIGGTHASLSVPRLELWSNEAKRGWWEPFKVERVMAVGEDPLRLQIRQLCRVIRGLEKPLVSAREGLAILKVIAAVSEAAATGQKIKVA
jgi:predicted dehydrogenase